MWEGAIHFVLVCGVDEVTKTIGMNGPFENKETNSSGGFRIWIRCNMQF